MKRITVGIIGLGRISDLHYPGYADNKEARIYAVCDINKETKRRTRVVRDFPNQKSCLMLVSALAMEQNEGWMGRRYLTFDGEVTIIEQDKKSRLTRSYIGDAILQNILNLTLALITSYLKAIVTKLRYLAKEYP